MNADADLKWYHDCRPGRYKDWPQRMFDEHLARSQASSDKALERLREAGQKLIGLMRADGVASVEIYDHRWVDDGGETPHVEFVEGASPRSSQPGVWVSVDS